MSTTLREATDEQLSSVSAGSVQLEGVLMVSSEVEGIVVFAHSGGSSLYSTRNRFIAHELRQAGLATLLVSLITHEEEKIQAPTLLIVGSTDEETVAMNQYALSQIQVEKQLEIISGASHLFVEPDALTEIGRLTSQWFKRYLTATVL